MDFYFDTGAKTNSQLKDEKVNPLKVSQSLFIRDSTPLKLKHISDVKLKSLLRKGEAKRRDAAKRAAEIQNTLLTTTPGILEPEHEMEKTWKLTQNQLKDSVDLATRRKIFDLELTDFGPYTLDYTINGRQMLIAGRKGHVASFDWQTGKLNCELHLRETVRDAHWLHNDTLFAVAQKKYTYIYDKQGTEIHCLKAHIEATKLDFLPHHFLLVSVGNAGWLKYQDVSTGQLVAENRTKLGQCNVMAQNPYNAIMNLGHSNGTVTLWSPTSSTPLVKILTHHGPVRALSVDLSGKYLATAGMDGHMKIWDIRTYKCLQSYFTPSPASSLAFSQTGLLAVSFGSRIQVWKDVFRKQKEPYMTALCSSMQSLSFCPYEDVLGVGHSKGISSLVIPGSGEPNFHTMQANPYQTVSQRQESEIHALLDKLQPESIAIDPNVIGKVDRAPVEVLREEAKREWEANHPTEKWKPRNKARGKSSSMRKYLSKQTNVIDAKRVQAKKLFEEQRAKRQKENPEETKRAIDVFRPKGN